METKKMIRPLRDLVLVRLHEVKDRTDSGIYIPVENRKNNKGTVCAVADGTPNYTMKLKVNDVVSFYQTSGIHVIYEGVDHLLLKEMECFAYED